MQVEYAKAPEVTRRRLYLETMESVLSNVTKVMLDAKGGSNVVYLPIDKLMERRGAETEISAKALTPAPPEVLPDTRPPLASEQERRDRARSRTREIR